ncbi:hypothetical protein [Amaricoccus solimangrovi]|nr:hypothetical protein [Amaricoccus solimangrovi]
MKRDLRSGPLVRFIRKVRREVTRAAMRRPIRQHNRESGAGRHE